VSIWSQDKYIKAWNYASAVHNGQLVPGTDIPYINHIGLVAMEAMAAIVHNTKITPNPINKPDLLVLCAILHDAIEDTNSTYGEINHHFGNDVANGVLALSKNQKLPSKQAQMQDSLARIKTQPQEIWMVKLADRITNLQSPPNHWHQEKINNYRIEAEIILAELGEANYYLAQRLRTKIEEYRQYS
jgi:(p)ppGpp synthase/HD superfamily hydrolase